MIFEESAEHKAYRAKVHAWLEAQGYPSRRGGRRELDFSRPGAIDGARAWQARKAAAGYAAMTWPVEYGGGGATGVEAQIYAEEEAGFAVPVANVFDIGLGMGGPTMLAFATPEDKARLLPRIAGGDDIWCQLFSEPAAGSDLAGIRTRAVRDEATGDWIVNGQKLWTSYAQFADWGLLIVRTDPSVPKHKGLTYFFVDMHSPGIEARPLRQLAGVREFNEVFFTDVRIPDANRLGAVNGGWRVAIATLMHERNFGGGGMTDFSGLFALARSRTINGRPAVQDGGIRRRIADAWIQANGLDLTSRLARGLLARGDLPGPEFSMGKLIGVRNGYAIAQLKAELGGSAALEADDPAVDEWLNYPRGRLAGGSDEVMANILAERVLGLPAEPRVDKDVPFDAIR